MDNQVKCKFSVVIPVYNVVNYLEECVKSVQQQSVDDYEIILVDDGSKDGCHELCDKIASSDNRVRVFHKNNGGLSDARNYGIERAKGEYVVFIDSDDYIKQGLLSEYSNLIMGNNMPDVILENGQYIYSESGIDKVIKYRGGDSFGCMSGEQALLVLLNGPSLHAAFGKCFKRKFWVDNGFCFRKGITSEDLDLIYKVIYKADKVVMTSEPYYVYRINREGSIMNKYQEKNIRDLFSIFEHWESFLIENNCDKSISDGIRRLLGNVYIFYVLLKLNEIGSSKCLLEDSQNYIKYLEYSDGYRLSRIAKVIGFEKFVKCFKILWWIDIHFRMLFDRKRNN